ncbi:hypothetical protein ACSQ67_020920 [Phaseolus vulgaris]
MAEPTSTLPENRVVAGPRPRTELPPRYGVQFTELEAESGHHERLVTWVREKKKKGSEVGPSWVEEIVDPALGSNYVMDEMEILATLALECVKEDREGRPNMSHVAERLQIHEHDLNGLNKD